MGATTYLRSELRAGTEFTITGASASNKNSRRKGLQVGSAGDLAVEKYVNEGKPIQNKWARFFLKEIKKRNIDLVRAKVYTKVPGLGLSSIVDVVGVRGDTIFVIEQKCTQYTLKQFMDIYHVPCARRATLVNGRPNTTYQADMIQTAIGVLGVRDVLPHATVKGLVVRCTSDGACSFEMDEKETDTTLLIRTKKHKSNKRHTNFVRSTSPHVATILQSLGYPTMERLRYGSVVGSRGNCFVVVALVHTSTPTSRMTDQQREGIRYEAKRLWTSRKRKVSVRGCVVLYTDAAGVYNTEYVITLHART